MAATSLAATRWAKFYKNQMKKHFIIIFILVLSIFKVEGQVSKDSELFISMKKQDSIFFERGFNRCDFDYLEKSVHKDFIFYHDQAGIQNLKAFLEKTKTNICSDPQNKPIRKVLPESLEVYPLYNNGVLYGVIQSGEHQFYLRQPGKSDLFTSTAKFTHIYLLDNGNWILKEVLSFDHKTP